MAKDPVCGMEVKEEKVCTDYKGKHYCFCSENCKKTFEQDPEKYAGENK